MSLREHGFLMLCAQAAKAQSDKTAVLADPLLRSLYQKAKKTLGAMANGCPQLRTGISEIGSSEHPSFWFKDAPNDRGILRLVSEVTWPTSWGLSVAAAANASIAPKIAGTKLQYIGRTSSNVHF